VPLSRAGFQQYLLNLGGMIDLLAPQFEFGLTVTLPDNEQGTKFNNQCYKYDSEI